jgi:hypothetical protein
MTNLPVGRNSRARSDRNVCQSAAACTSNVVRAVPTARCSQKCPEMYGYDDIAAALRDRGGLPEQAYLTGNLDDIDDFSACQITKKEDWVELYA